MRIEITQESGKPVRAVVFVPAQLATAPGVCGGATEQGPWIEGFGSSPSEALRDLQCRLGAAYMAVMP